jgi:ribosomal protein S27E
MPRKVKPVETLTLCGESHRYRCIKIDLIYITCGNCNHEWKILLEHEKHLMSCPKCGHTQELNKQ